MRVETFRERVARLRGETARLIMLDALGSDRERVAAAFGASIEKSAAATMSAVMVGALEPEIRRRLAEAGALPS